MARQFKEPTFLAQQPTKLQALAAPVSQAISTLPELYDQYKLRRMQQQQLLKEQEYKRREMEAKYGTGRYENIQPGTMTGPAPVMGEDGTVQNPEEVLFGGEATMPTFSEETEEQKLRRMGSDSYKVMSDAKKGKSSFNSAVFPMGVDSRNNRLIMRDRMGGVFYHDTGEEFRGDASAILPVQRKTLPAETVKEGYTFDSLRQQANDITSLAESADFIGPVVGRWEQLKSKFVDTPEYTELNGKVQSLIETAYALSGKQISEKEIKQLQEAFWSQITEPKGNFLTKMELYKGWLARKAGLREKALTDAGFFMPKNVKDETKEASTPSVGGAGIKTKSGKKVTISGFTVTP